MEGGHRTASDCKRNDRCHNETRFLHVSILHFFLSYNVKLKLTAMPPPPDSRFVVYLSIGRLFCVFKSQKPLFVRFVFVGLTSVSTIGLYRRSVTVFKVHTDEQTRVYSAKPSLEVTHSSTN